MAFRSMGLLAYVSLGFLLAGPSLTGAEADYCPMEWLPFQGHCYKLFTDKLTWSDAAISCQNHCPGCNLASIHSSEESAEVAKYVTKYRGDSSNVWIGLRDPRKVGACQTRRWLKL
uniref:C-type lectin domain-containing protein n=1 Tax=Salvator merianae TaxID=96440 RepID=A0A8D0C5T7_SALMN